MGQRHCVEAKRVVTNLEAELAAAGQARGETLVWSAADRELIDMLVRDIDRRGGLRRRYAATRDAKMAVKLSNELRQIDTAIMRLLNAIRTDVPQPESLVTLKNRRAANVRWQRERERNAGA
jgi:hypothetical protein